MIEYLFIGYLLLRLSRKRAYLVERTIEKDIEPVKPKRLTRKQKLKNEKWLKEQMKANEVEFPIGF